MLWSLHFKSEDDERFDNSGVSTYQFLRGYGATNKQSVLDSSPHSLIDHKNL